MARILVIDDDATVRTLIVAAVQEHGHEAIEAHDGPEGLARCHESKPDLVITDLVMPEKEGIETIIELRRETPQVPIIAMSGSEPGDSNLKMAAKLGASFTLAKPFTTEQLLQAIGAALSARTTRVLVVDDDPNGRYLTVHHLKRAFPSITVLEAEHATAALATLDRTEVDVIITDNGIGPKDGVTMIRELRARQFAKPIIMASMNSGLERKALEAGANDFVFSGDDREVLRLVTKYLRPESKAARPT